VAKIPKAKSVDELAQDLANQFVYLAARIRSENTGEDIEDCIQQMVKAWNKKREGK
jgi:hypothetical protein